MEFLKLAAPGASRPVLGTANLTLVESVERAMEHSTQWQPPTERVRYPMNRVHGFQTRRRCAEMDPARVAALDKEGSRRGVPRSMVSARLHGINPPAGPQVVYDTGPPR